MENKLEERFYESLKKISLLQKEIERENDGVFFEDAERKRFDLVREYLFLGEHDNAIAVLKSFIDNYISEVNFGRSLLTLQMFSELIFLMSEKQLNDEVNTYMNLFLRCASNMSSGYLMDFKDSIIRYGEAFSILVKKETDKFPLCLDYFDRLIDFYNSNQDFFPLSFLISLYEYKSSCLSAMKRYDEAIIVLDEALNVENIDELLYRRMDTYRKISEIYEKKEDYPSALACFDKYYEIRQILYKAKDYSYSNYLITLYGLSRQEMQTNMLVSGNRDLEDQILRDGMTGLYNRRFLHKLTTDYFTNENASSVWGAIMFDIDFFKLYNDNYGHPAGDSVLSTFGNILKIYESGNVFPIRYGGEEFLIIIKNATMDELYKTSGQISSQLMAFQIPHAYSSVDSVVTVSGGYSCMSCQKTNDFLDLIRQADSSLYEAKNQGRNRVIQYRR